MGIFSSKKKTTITGIHQRMLSDDNFTYSSQMAVTHWMWENSGKAGVDLTGKDLSDYLIKANQQSLPRKFDKLYRWASKPDKYHFGLPKSSLSENPQNQILNETVKYLNGKHGGEIQVIAFELGDRDFYMEAWHELVEHYGYDTSTNELTKLSEKHGYPCYLKDGYLALSQLTKDEYKNVGFDNQAIPFNYGKYFDREENISREQTTHITATSDHMVITYGFEMDVLPKPDINSTESEVYLDYIKEIWEETLQLDLSDINPPKNEGDLVSSDNDYIYVTYLFNDDYYWFRYEYLSGGIASIDIALTAKEAFGQYYPRLYVKLGSDISSWSKDAKPRMDTEKAFKKANLKLGDVTQQLINSVGGEYGNVRGLYVFMGVQVNASKGQTELAEYCYRYFMKLYEMSDTEVVSKTITTTNAQGASITKQVVDDGVKRCVGGVQTIQDGESSQTLQYSFIEIKEYSGVAYNGNNQPINKGEYGLVISFNTSKTKHRLFRKRTSVYSHHFRFQIEEDKFIELTVHNLSQATWIAGFSFTKSGDDGELVIPIDRSIIKHLTNKERELLFHKSLHVAMIHMRVTKTKWYQRGIFKVVLAVIAIAITVFTGGAGTPLATLIKTATVSAIKAIAISYAVNALVSVAVKLGLNPKIAGVIAFVASISLAGMANGFDFSKVLTAPNIMKALNQSFNFYEKMLQVQYQDTLNQMKQLDNKMTNQNELLKEKQKLLDTKVFNPTQEMLRSNYTPTVNLFETPDMFYDRHYNYNVVAVSHGLITNFVQGSLQNKQPYQPKQQDIEDVLIIT